MLFLYSLVASGSVAFAHLLFVVLLLVPARGAESANGDCGIPLGDAEPKVTDCLFVLRAAVQLEQCAPCVCDVNDSGGITASDALLCLRFAVGQDVVLTCPECVIVQCPGFVEWTTHAGIGGTCATDDQCVAGNCDHEIGRCRTATELDLGWKGTAHDVDLNEGSVLRLLVGCEGNAAGCGECEIQGVDAQGGSCRCANDSRVICDSPFAADAAACPACSGGAFAGMACAADAQCEGGPCARHCVFDPELVCSTNADCPQGRKLCDADRRCGNGDGASCAEGGDCIGTCTAAATCECYDAPPQPVASVEFPFCMVARLAEDVSGTVDVDTGASAVIRDLRLHAYAGVSLAAPCPVCGGTCAADPGQLCVRDDDCAPNDTCTFDATPGDGLRGGACVGGAHEGQTCDVGATNASFPASPAGPAESGGAYSLDCMPNGSAGFTGSGLLVHSIETTGTSSLAATVPCDPRISLSKMCPCLVCSGSLDVACNDDDDCSSVRSCTGKPEQACNGDSDCMNFDLGTCTAFGDTRCTGSLATLCTTNSDCEAVDFGTCGPATCTSRGRGIFPEPNACNGGLCADGGNGEGSCTLGPDDKFCDGIVKADGSGIRRCYIDDDCSAELLGVDAGACTLAERRACFPASLGAAGAADPFHPLAVAAFCAPPTTSIGASTSIGLPGPARLRRQSSLQSFCANDAATSYVPGGNACPQ